MRLTNAIREEMVAAIMRDVPHTAKERAEEVSERARKDYIDSLPQTVQDCYSKHPEYIASRQASWTVRPENTHWNDETVRYDSVMIKVEAPFLNDYKDEAHVLKACPWLEKEIENITKLVTKRHQARKEVIKALKSVTTAKRLREVYPDLAKYLPSDISGQALAVPQALPNLHKAGWPKEKTSETRE